MRSPEEVKLRAKTLRSLLALEGHEITQGHSLEIISKLDGHRDWNTLSAQLNNSRQLLPIPKAWRISGDQSQQYEFGCDASITVQNHHPAVIRSKPSAKGNGFATLMQSVKIGKYAGKRVMLKADIKAVDCDGSVTIWLRADGPIPGQNLAFDNMEDRTRNDGPLVGTSGWATRKIVLEIPENAVTLNYGFYIRGKGIAYASAFELEIVTAEQPITSSFGTPLAEPANLQFSES